MISDIKRVVLVGAGAFLISFLFLALTGHRLWGGSGEPSTIDIAVLVFCATVMLQSIAGVVINNFIFLGQGKNWQDFWSGNPFEYLDYKKYDLSEKWKMARAKFCLYFLCFIFSFAIIWIYSALRPIG